MKLLIAEDDPVARAILIQILRSCPEHQATVAEDGDVAWALLNDPARAFDVILLDLMLPKLDGFELIQRIRSVEILQRLQIILCTAANDRETVVRAAQLGIRHYLVKPCSAESVKAKLQQIQTDPEAAAERRLA
jgi:two-component system chemotaxis response regulator CheY